MIDKEYEKIILEVHKEKEQKLSARRLEKIIKFKHGKHIPHNRIHDVLLNSEKWKSQRE